MPQVRYPSRELLQFGRSWVLVFLLGLGPTKDPRSRRAREPSSRTREARRWRDSFRQRLTPPWRLLKRFLLAAMRWVSRGLTGGREALRLIRLARPRSPLERGDALPLGGLCEAEQAVLDPGKVELRQRVVDLEARLQEALDEARNARADSAYWREEFFKLQKVRAGSASPQVPEPLPTRVADALAQVEREHPERISIKLNSVSDKASPFLDAEAVYKALVFLATTYVDSRSGRQPCQDLDVACRLASGFQYKSGQSPVTVGRYRNDYETTWRGEKVPLEEHLSKGTNRDPRYALRIGFFFDRKLDRVVVGYVGRHQTTAAT